MTDETAAPTPRPKDQQDTYADLTARLAAADLGWSHEHGDPPANPDYIRWLAFQVMAFKPPLIAGVYVDDAMLDDMRDGLHGDNCGCGEWDSHSQEYVERMDETIHAVLYPLRHPVRPVPQGTEDSDYREQIAEVLHAAAVDVPGTPQVGPALIERQIAALWPRVSPLVEQLRQARAAYNRMAGHAVDRAAERDRYYLAWQSAARGRRRARVERDTARNQFLDHYNGTADQLDRIRELQDALRERTGQRDEVRAEADRLSHELGQHRRVERDAYERHRTALVAALGDVPHKSVDAELALDGLRTTAVVLPEDWRQRLGNCPSSGAGVDLVASWRAAPVEATSKQLRVAPKRGCCVGCDGTGASGDPDTGGPCWDCRGTGHPHDGPCDEPAAAAPVEAETPPRTRDEVVEAWADTWDGVDRTPDWVRVVEPCPVPDCTIPQVHGHEGYGLRFTPVAQPAHPRPPLDPPPNSLNERLHIRRSGAPGTGQWGARWPGSAWVTNLGEAQARIEVERHAKAGAVLVWRESKDHDWAEVASPGTGTEAGE